MFRLLNQRGHVIALRVTEKLTDEDYAHLTPYLEHKINHFDNLHLLVELDNYSGWGEYATAEDLQLGLDNADDIDKLAVVGGDGNWRVWYDNNAPANDWDDDVHVRYFNQYQIDDAWLWLRD